MTKKEFEALEGDEKEFWSRVFKEHVIEWETEKKTIREKPYPFNFLHACYLNCEIDEAAANFLDAALATLTEKEQDVVVRIYKEGQSLDEVAEKYEVVPGSVPAMLTRILRKMRHPTRMNRFFKTIRIIKNAQFDQEN